MAFIVSYQKFIDSLRTVELRLPEGDSMQRIGTELCTLKDGLTYVSLPEGVELPANQPPEIADTITDPITVTEDLRYQILGESPHCRLIADRVIQRIRERYPLNDELFLNRVATGVLAGLYEYQDGEEAEVLAFGTWAEECRQWGRAQRAALGL
jgi:hypothetical protein